MRIVKWLRSPAFSEENRRATFWIIKVMIAVMFFFHFSYPTVYISVDPSRFQAEVDARLRDAAIKRMQEACFTEQEINDYWYNQGFWEYPNKLLVIIRGRESVCGGRGSCGCESKEEPKDSV